MDSRIRESFDKQGLMTTLGVRIESVQKGCVTLSAPIRAEASQQHGFAHAGVTFALGDSAAGYTALTVMPAGSEVLTSEMKIHLLAPARGDARSAAQFLLRSYSTVTDFARFRGWSTSVPLATAV